MPPEVRSPDAALMRTAAENSPLPGHPAFRSAKAARASGGHRSGITPERLLRQPCGSAYRRGRRKPGCRTVQASREALSDRSTEEASEHCLPRPHVLHRGLRQPADRGAGILSAHIPPRICRGSGLLIGFRVQALPCLPAAAAYLSMLRRSAGGSSVGCPDAVRTASADLRSAHRQSAKPYGFDRRRGILAAAPHRLHRKHCPTRGPVHRGSVRALPAASRAGFEKSRTRPG